ncbi:hypothetical protein [Frankia sp. QA3]|uniref:hypothetical protein n=1 Tax=Frankia sp. QA3 TaxID=710111 RepID=UPI000269C136|nr:hypothetical protein [Frankia sp. QA3]EIV92912.1 hypothetical protein FraQA3DRAFT_2580 [Frankia sp. QA3]
MKPVLYLPRRAIEDAATIPGVRPLRLFPVLWPLWRTEISASVHDPQAYEVLDHFLVRAVAEGRLDSVDDLARFFSLSAALVRRCLGFLATIGHLTIQDGDGDGGGRVALTELGLSSWRAGVRYVPKESRQTLLFERFTGRPLPRAYYDGNLTVLPTSKVPEDRTPGRTRFRALFDATPLRPDAVTALAARPDRAEFNVPAALGQIQVLAVSEGYLPCYLIQTAGHGLLAYSGVSEQRDGFLAEVCREIDSARMLIEAEQAGDPREIWTGWLARSPHGPGTLRQTSAGMWRIVLPASSFGGEGKLAYSRLGSFELWDHHIAQLWCDDAAARRTAVHERALRMTQLSDVTTVGDLRRRAEPVARALDVAAPSLEDLREHARRTKALHLLGRLDLLSAAP